MNFSLDISAYHWNFEKGYMNAQTEDDLPFKKKKRKKKE